MWEAEWCGGVWCGAATCGVFGLKDSLPGCHGGDTLMPSPLPWRAAPGLGPQRDLMLFHNPPRKT